MNATGDSARTGAPGGPPAPPAAGAAWVLLPVTWCAWLLVWLVPSLLVAPHLASPGLWLSRGTAPAAVLAAATFFLVAVWPFWPALARSRQGDAAPPAVGVAWLGLSVLELAMLLALALPFGLVAWSVGDASPLAGPLAATAGVWAVFGLGVRMAAAGMGPGAARWLMFGAALACVGPLALEYSAGETLGVGFPRILEASPIVGAIRLALEGWPEGTWPWVARVVLWPAAGVALGLLGWWRSCRARRRAVDG
jgi:hypothetical protein